MFQNLRQGNTIYVLDKSDSPTLKMGQVLRVGTPMPSYQTQQPGVMNGFQAKYELTVHAKVDGQEGDLAHLPADQTVHDYGNMIVADSREAMITAVDAMKQQSLQLLESVDHHKKVVAACDEIFKSLNPSFAKEQARDEALKDLNDRLESFEKKFGSALTNIEKMLSGKGAK